MLVATTAIHALVTSVQAELTHSAQLIFIVQRVMALRIRSGEH